ncbi:MAG TPA: redoxin domain-containing protein [Gemmataceae bacterium]|nr:redoxin domain-containing protein [Gemmataceae bacterium]
MAKRLLAVLMAATLLGVGLGQLALSEEKASSNIGKRVSNFTLTDPRDQKQVCLADLKDKKAVAVIFVGTECPINNSYMPRLVELHKEYADQGVQFLAVNSNVQDTAERVAAHARKYEIPFPVLKDEGNVVADQFGAVRTPEAFLLDAEGRIVYRGRIDDQYGIRIQRPRPTTRELADAIDAVLAGKPVPTPTAPVAGCIIARAARPKETGTVTYAKDVARIIQNRCQECHRPGQIGPMPLLTYRQVQAWSETIREVIEEGRMPPWHADPNIGQFSNDRRLTKEEKETLLAWIEQGCPKGDDKDLPPPRQFDPNWKIGTPDLVVSMPEEFEVPAVTPKNGVPYKYFTVDPGFTEDKWVVRAESKPGAPEVVHHIIVFISPPGQAFFPGSRGGRVLCGTAPGDTALMLPEGVGKRIPAGSKLVFQMHYTPNGRAQKDRSSVAMIFAKEPPPREAITIPVGNPMIRIPPGADNHRVESEFTLKTDGYILSFMPHMHLRGKDFLYEAIHPDGRTEVLLSVPKYDFNWQSSYRLAKPYFLPKGGKIHCVAHFDNSEKNPNNPDPTKEVRWGDQTWEEMMIGWTEVMFDRQALAPEKKDDKKDGEEKKGE